MNVPPAIYNLTHPREHLYLTLLVLVTGLLLITAYAASIGQESYYNLCSETCAFNFTHFQGRQGQGYIPTASNSSPYYPVSDGYSYCVCALKELTNPYVRPVRSPFE